MQTGFLYRKPANTRQKKRQSKEREEAAVKKQRRQGTEARRQLLKQTFFVQPIDYVSSNNILKSAAAITYQNSVLVRNLVYMHNSSSSAGEGGGVTSRIAKDQNKDGLYSFSATHSMIMVPNRDTVLNTTTKARRRSGRGAELLQTFSTNISALAASSKGGSFPGSNNSPSNMSSQRFATLSSAAAQYYSDLYAGPDQQQLQHTITSSSSARAVKVMQNLNKQYIGMQELLRVAQIKDQWLRYGPTVYNPTQQEQLAKQLLHIKMMSVSAESYPLTNAQAWTIQLQCMSLMTAGLAFAPWATAFCFPEGLPYLTATTNFVGEDAKNLMSFMTTANSLIQHGPTLFTGCWYVLKGGVDWYNTGEWRYFTTGIAKSTGSIINMIAFAQFGPSYILAKIVFNCVVQIDFDPRTGRFASNPVVRMLNYQSEGDLIVQDMRIAAEARQRMDDAYKLEQELQEYTETMKRLNIESKGRSWPIRIWNQLIPEAKQRTKNITRFILTSPFVHHAGFLVAMNISQGVLLKIASAYLKEGGAAAILSETSTTASILSVVEEYILTGPVPGREYILPIGVVLETITGAIISQLFDLESRLTQERLTALVTYQSIIFPIVSGALAKLSVILSNLLVHTVIFLLTNKTIGKFPAIRSLQRFLRRKQTFIMGSTQLVQAISQFWVQTYLTGLLHKAVPMGVFSNNEEYTKYVNSLQDKFYSTVDYFSTPKTQFITDGDVLYERMSSVPRSTLDDGTATLTPDKQEEEEEADKNDEYLPVFNIKVETVSPVEEGSGGGSGPVDYLTYVNSEAPEGTPTQPLDPNLFSSVGLYVKRVDADGNDVFVPVDIESAQYNMLHHGKGAVDDYVHMTSSSSSSASTLKDDMQKKGSAAMNNDWETGMQSDFIKDMKRRLKYASQSMGGIKSSLANTSSSYSLLNSFFSRTQEEEGNLFYVWTTNAVERGEYKTVLEALHVQKEIVRLEQDMADIDDMLGRLQTADIYGTLQARTIQAAQGRFNQALNEFIKDTEDANGAALSWSNEEYKEQLLNRVFISNPMITFDEIEYVRTRLETPGLIVDIRNPEIIEVIDQVQTMFSSNRQFAESLLEESGRIAEEVSNETGETFHEDMESMFRDLRSKFASGDVASALESYKNADYVERRNKIYFAKKNLVYNVPVLDENVQTQSNSEWVHARFSGMDDFSVFMRSPYNEDPPDVLEGLLPFAPGAEEAAALEEELDNNFFEPFAGSQAKAAIKEERERATIERVEAQLTKLLRDHSVFIPAAGQGVSFSARDVNSLIMQGRYGDAEILLFQIQEDVRKLEDAAREQTLQAAIRQAEKLKDAPSVFLLGYEPLQPLQLQKEEEPIISDSSSEQQQIVEEGSSIVYTTTVNEQSLTEEAKVVVAEESNDDVFMKKSVIENDLHRLRKNLTRANMTFYQQIVNLEHKIELLESISEKLKPSNASERNYKMIMYNYNTMAAKIGPMRSSLREIKDNYFYASEESGGQRINNIISTEQGQQRIRNLESRVRTQLDKHLTSMIQYQRGSDSISYTSNKQDDKIVTFMKSMHRKDIVELDAIMESRENLANIAESVYASSGDASLRENAVKWREETQIELDRLKTSIRTLESFFERPEFDRNSENYHFDMDLVDQYLDLRSELAKEVFQFKDKLFLDTHSFVGELHTGMYAAATDGTSTFSSSSSTTRSKEDGVNTEYRQQAKTRNYFKTIEDVKRHPHTQHINRLLHGLATFVDGSLSKKSFGNDKRVPSRTEITKLTPDDYAKITTFMKTALLGEQLGYLRDGTSKYISNGSMEWRDQIEEMTRKLSWTANQVYYTEEIMYNISVLQERMTADLFGFIYGSQAYPVDMSHDVPHAIDSGFRYFTTVLQESNAGLKDDDLISIVMDFTKEIGLYDNRIDGQKGPTTSTPFSHQHQHVFFSDDFLSMIRGAKSISISSTVGEKTQDDDDTVTTSSSSTKDQQEEAVLGVYNEMRKYLLKSLEIAEESGNPKAARAIREDLLPNLTLILETPPTIINSDDDYIPVPILERFDLKGGFKACFDIERMLYSGGEYIPTSKGFLHEKKLFESFVLDDPPPIVQISEQTFGYADDAMQTKTTNRAEKSEEEKEAPTNDIYISVYEDSIRYLEEKLKANQFDSVYEKKSAEESLRLFQRAREERLKHDYTKNTSSSSQKNQSQPPPPPPPPPMKDLHREPSSDPSTLDGMHAEKVSATNRKSAQQTAQTLDQAVVGASILHEAVIKNGKHIFKARTNVNDKTNLKTMRHERVLHGEYQKKILYVIDSNTHHNQQSSPLPTENQQQQQQQQNTKTKKKTNSFMKVEEAEAYKSLVVNEPSMWNFYKSTGLSDDAARAKALQRYMVALQHNDISMANAQLCYMAGLNHHEDIQQYIRTNGIKTSTIPIHSSTPPLQQQQAPQMRDMTVQEFLSSPSSGKRLIEENIIPTYQRHQTSYNWVRDNVIKVLQGSMVNFSPCLMLDNQEIAYGKAEVFIYDKDPVTGITGELNSDLTKKCLVNPFAVHLAGYASQSMNIMSGMTGRVEDIEYGLGSAAVLSLVPGIGQTAAIVNLKAIAASLADSHIVYNVLPEAEKMIAGELEQSVDDVVKNKYAGISSAYLTKFLALLSAASNKEKHILQNEDMSPTEVHQYSGSKIHIADFVFSSVYAATRDMENEESRNQHLNMFIDTYSLFMERLYDFNVLSESLEENTSVDAFVTSTMTSLRKIGFKATDVFKLDLFGGPDGYVAAGTEELARWGLWAEREDNDEKWDQLTRAVIESFVGSDEEEGGNGAKTPFPRDRIPLWRSTVLGAYSIIVAKDATEFAGTMALNSHLGSDIMMNLMFGTPSSSMLRRHLADWHAFHIHEHGDLERIIHEGKWYKPDSEKSLRHWATEGLFTGYLNVFKSSYNSMFLFAGKHDVLH